MWDTGDPSQERSEGNPQGDDDCSVLAGYQG